jgi:hypothetical protein
VEAAPQPTIAVRNKRLMDALVLALGSSAIAKTINAGTLRYFIEFTFRDMFDGQKFDLGPLWNVLAVEPGLGPELITPAFLLFKEWELRLGGIEVRLPAPLAALSKGEINAQLENVVVKAGELDKILLDPGGVVAAPVAGASGKVAAPAPPRLSHRYLVADGEGHAGGTAASAGHQPAAPRTNRRRVIAAGVAVVVTLAGLGYVGFRLAAPPGNTFSLGPHAAILRLEPARRVRYAVTGRLADPRWDRMSRAERHQALDRLLAALEGQGVQSVIVQDGAGHTQGLASTVGGERTVQVE